MDFKRRMTHIIEIRASANDKFVVTVGCATMVYDNVPELIEDLGEFLDDPEGMEKKFNQTLHPTSISTRSFSVSSSSSS